MIVCAKVIPVMKVRARVILDLNSEGQGYTG